MKQVSVQNAKHKRKTRIVPIVGVLVLVFCVCFGVFAKYMQNNKYDNTVLAEDFYFTVDLLGDTNTVQSLERTVDLYGGGEHELSFTVQNFFDEKRVNGTAIEYTVKIDTENSTYSGASLGAYDASYTLAAGPDEASKEFVLTIPAGYKEGDRVIVTVASSAPYEKTMTLTFLLHRFTADVSYRVIDQAGSSTASLIIMTNVEVEKGKLFLDWSGAQTRGGVFQAEENILQIDTTNLYILDEIDGVLQFETNKIPEGGYLKTATVTRSLKPGESILIYFFKIDPQADYSKDTTAATYADGKYTVTLGK